AGEPVGKAAALNALLGDIGLAGLLANLVDLHDVRVIELGTRLGLGPKASQAGRIEGSLCCNHLEGHDPVEAVMPGLVHDSKTACTQDAQDLVAGAPRRAFVPLED